MATATTTLNSVKSAQSLGETKVEQNVKKILILTKTKKSPPHTVQATDYLFRGYCILGVSMPMQHKFAYVIYSLVVNLLVTLFLPLAFTLSYMHLEGAEQEIGNILTSFQVAINVYGCSIKLIIMAFLLKKLRSADVVLNKLDARCTKPQEIAELQKLVHFGRRMVVLFSIAYWSYATSTFLGSVLMGRPPYAVFNPLFDWRTTRLNFVMQALMEFGLIDIACFQQVVDDSYAVIYVCILRTHIKIFLERIEKLGSNTEISLKQNVEELKLCIIDHKNLLDLYNIISPVISITIFIQFMITAAILGTTLINILLFATDFSSRVASCFYILAVVTEIFPLCYYSQCLMDDSDRLAQVIFHSNWMGQNVRYRKMLIFFIHRSQRRMELTAGKLFPITLNSFLSIAKFSFSLYTFIKEMGIKEKFQLE